ncbi:HD domain-containing phosphohydrolase [Roseospira navarrensis]|nr:HD domain-containing phosphohydrolase [Roseospira navarrensis]
MLLDLREVVFNLSGVLDFVGVTDINHGKRVAFLSHAIGQTLGLNRHHQARLFEAALLHDAGVSSTREHRVLVSAYDIPDAYGHCERGHDLLSGCAPLAHLAPLVAGHHSAWFELADGAHALDPDQRLSANIIYLADRVDAMLTGDDLTDPLMRRDEILGVLDRESGDRFAPDVVEAFRAAASRDALWFGLDADALPIELAPMARDGRYTLVSFPVLTELASIFAHIVDAKCRFTATHSVAVGAICARLAALAGLNEDQQRKVQIAGLLHDIGKLRIPDTILEKSGPLDAAERATMNRHAYYTHQILRQIQGFEDIAEWAGSHHEALDGSGYPFGKSAPDLPTESRIVAVADVFQALAQTRPYREAMPMARIREILGDMARARKLDSDLVGLAIDHADTLTACGRGGVCLDQVAMSRRASRSRLASTWAARSSRACSTRAS